MAVGTGVLLGIGGRVFFRGIPGAGASGGIGLKAAAATAASGGLFAALDELKLGGMASLSATLLAIKPLAYTLSEANKNEERVNAALKDCESLYPGANHSFSFLNF